jgi:hypothetical protein
VRPFHVYTYSSVYIKDFASSAEDVKKTLDGISKKTWENVLEKWARASGKGVRLGGQNVGKRALGSRE